MNIQALDEACKHVGTQEALAALLGVKSASISGWRERGRVPAERCLAIERATGGKVTCHELRPDVFPAPISAQPSEDQPADGAQQRAA